MVKGSRIALSAIWFLAVSSAQAGPPFVTDDPEPPSPGGWEINVPFILERTRHKTEMDAPLFDVNYGLPNVQLKLEIPVKVVHEDGDGTAAGPGDLLLGVKWRFFNDEKSQVQLGVYPQVLLPTGDQRRDLGDGRPAYVTPVVAQKRCGKWTLYGNVGYSRQTAADKRDFWYSGGVLQREVSDHLTLGIELFGNTPKERRSCSEFAFNFGGARKLSDHFNLLFSAGCDLIGETSLTTYLGVQYVSK
jgi:hypothetical protein